MNVSTPPKHPWQPQRYKHLLDAEQAEWIRCMIDLIGAKSELLELRDKMSLFDDTHARVIEEIAVRSAGRPPRKSCTIDGIEIAHLLSADTPITCDSTEPYWNIVTLPFICRKFSSCDTTEDQETK